MEGTKPRTASSIGMFDMLKGAGMLTIVFAQKRWSAYRHP